jgi:ElaB/YqjD/DUF883 family membrane-anchored ribosome-binding protein
MGSHEENYVPESTPSPEQVVAVFEIRKLHDEITRLREQISRGDYASSSKLTAERFRQMRKEVKSTATQAKARVGEIDRRLRVAVRDKPITVITVSAALGYFLALLTWPYARRER